MIIILNSNKNYLIKKTIKNLSILDVFKIKYFKLARAISTNEVGACAI